MARAAPTLDQILSRLAREGELYERLAGGRVRCYACGHRCLIPPGQRGICKVRWNEDGRLLVPAGYVAGLQLDPVEKKPFFHAYPGARALSFGMLGCDYHCSFCQNALTSQALRDPSMGVEPQRVTAAQIADAAVRHGARILTSTCAERYEDVCNPRNPPGRGRAITQVIRPSSEPGRLSWCAPH